MCRNTVQSPLEKRAGGLLLPLSALPSRFGAGDLGPEAHRFVDFLAASGQKWWQMLPVAPLGKGDSPYDAESAFAGDPLWISLESLVKEGWLKASEVRSTPFFNPARIDYSRARTFREPLLRKAYDRFKVQQRGTVRRAYRDFCRREKYWLDDFCLYRAFSTRWRDSAWTAWPAHIRRREPAVLREAPALYCEEIGYHQFLQFQFDAQWNALRHYAAGRGVRFLGDIAIFVSPLSSDVWAHQDLFRLDAQGRPTVVAGVPPDYFNEDGQRWGNPHYDWNRLARTGYRWWIERFRSALARFDAVRLDHFIGFHRFWEIPASAPTARTGRYVPGPGARFFQAAEKKLGRLPFIAEDLGVITAEVKALRERFQFPGMKVLQFAFGNDPEAPCYQPHNYPVRCVAYTGTHDNDTLSGWWHDAGSRLSTRTRAQIRAERENAIRYLGGPFRDMPSRFIRLLWASVAAVAILPAQDILGLGSKARLNRPGIAAGNWTWRMRPGQLTPMLAARLRSLSELYER